MQDWLVGWSLILLQEQELQNLLTRKDFNRIYLDRPRPYSHLLSTILPLYNGHFWQQKQSGWSMPVLSVWINPAVGNWCANNTFIPLPRSHEQCHSPKIVPGFENTWKASWWCSRAQSLLHFGTWWVLLKNKPRWAFLLSQLGGDHSSTSAHSLFASRPNGDHTKLLQWPSEAPFFTDNLTTSI